MREREKEKEGERERERERKRERERDIGCFHKDVRVFKGGGIADVDEEKAKKIRKIRNKTPVHLPRLHQRIGIKKCFKKL